MNLLKICNKSALIVQCGSVYKGIAFDGCFFYLTCPDLCKIIKYNKSFCEIECFNTAKPYSCICYDLHKNCFWASSDKCCEKLFKLNCCMNEIDCISVRPYEGFGAIITGVSYDCNENRLLVSFTNCVISICPEGNQQKELLRHSRSIWNMGILSVSPGNISIEMQDSCQYIAVYNCYSALKFKCALPDGYFAKNIIFNPCTLRCDNNYHFYILATKNGCYSYILECIFDWCDLDINQCNYALCGNSCCSKPSSKESCSDVIESVALIETSLSHILNAEGEKLQKIIACADDVDQILCANQAINDTIVKITHLEIILHDKLSVIENCCNACNQNDQC